MNKVRFQQAGALGLLTLSNPPLNLFDEELMTDLRAAVDEAGQLPLRALLVRADGKHFSGGADVAVARVCGWGFAKVCACTLVSDARACIMTAAIAAKNKRGRVPGEVINSTYSNRSDGTV